MAKVYRDDLSKLDYDGSDAKFQWGPEGIDEPLIDQGGVKMNFDPSRYGVGHGQPDPMRHLDDNNQPDPTRHLKK